MDDRIDLSPLDPRRDEALLAGRVRAIALDAMTARAGKAGVLADLSAWAGPAMAAAAAVALVAGVTMFSTRGAAAPLPRTVLDAVGIPVSVAEWAQANHYPSTAELVAALTRTGGPAQP
jgi:hypothetical protein